MREVARRFVCSLAAVWLCACGSTTEPRGPEPVVARGTDLSTVGLGAGSPAAGRALSRTPRAGFQRKGSLFASTSAAQHIELDAHEVRLQAVRPTKAPARLAISNQISVLARATTVTARARARQALSELPPSRSEPAPLTLRTLSVARDGYECLGGAPQLQRGSDAAAERQFATCSERWAGGATSAEQSFLFPAQPAGKGDLVVRVEARFGSRNALVRRGERGLELHGSEGQAFNYGHGVWVDAQARHTAVPARWNGHSIELRVPATVLAASAYPALLDPEIGPDIGTDPAVLVATDVGHNPVVASDGNGFLAVQEVSGRIRAVRVDSAGQVLDTNWLDFGDSDVDQYYPSVAFGAGHYLVTWSAFGHDGSDTIEGRLVSPDGQLVGAAKLVLADQALYPSVAWNGSRFFVSWLSLADTAHVALATFDSAGIREPGSEHAVSNPGSIAYPRVAVTATAGLVTWEDYQHDDTLGDVPRALAARTDANGVPQGSPFALSASAIGAQTISVASGNDRFLAVWQTADNAVFGSLVAQAGAFIAQDVAISHSDAEAGLASVAFSGAGFLVGWTDGRDGGSLYGTRVSALGVAASSDTALALDAPRYVAFGSDRTALAWSGSRFLLSYLGDGIEGSLLDTDLQIAAGRIPLTGVANAQGYPRSVWNGQNYIVAWTDERNSSQAATLRGERIDTSGQVLDPQGLALSAPDVPTFGGLLASTGLGSTLVSWDHDEASAFLRTVRSDGTLGAIQSLPVPGALSLASDGNGYLGVSTNSAGDAVEGHLLDGSGAPLKDFAVDATSYNTSPTVFTTGHDYLVVYSLSGTRLVPVSSSGIVGQSLQLTPEVEVVQAASGPHNVLLTWTDYNSTQVIAQFYSAGSLAPTTFTLTDSSAGYTAALAWDGTRYWAVWETSEHFLQGVSIDENGALGTTEVLLNEESYAPVLASNGRGQMLLSYSQYGVAYQTRRVHSRLIGGSIPLGGAGGAGGSGGSAGATSQGGAAQGGAAQGGALSTAGGGSGTSGTEAGGVPNSAGSSNIAGASAGGALGSSGGMASAGSAGSSNQLPKIFGCALKAAAGAGDHGNSSAIACALLAAFAACRRRRSARGRAQT